jgi:hypothetical protein
MKNVATHNIPAYVDVVVNLNGRRFAMQTEDTGLRAAIRNASSIVQETASKSEAAAIDAVGRVEAALASAQATWNGAREFAGEVAQSLGHAGRTTYDGIMEYNGALGRYGKDALGDTIDVGRKTLQVKSLKEFLDLHADFVSRRSQAMFDTVNQLNAIAQLKTVTAWSPMGETLRKAGEARAA